MTQNMALIQHHTQRGTEEIFLALFSKNSGDSALLLSLKEKRTKANQTTIQ